MWLDSLQVKHDSRHKCPFIWYLGEEVIIRNEIYFEMFWLPEEVKEIKALVHGGMQNQTIKGQKEIGAGIS